MIGATRGRPVEDFPVPAGTVIARGLRRDRHARDRRVPERDDRDVRRGLGADRVLHDASRGAAAARRRPVVRTRRPSPATPSRATCAPSNATRHARRIDCREHASAQVALVESTALEDQRAAAAGAVSPIAKHAAGARDHQRHRRAREVELPRATSPARDRVADRARTSSPTRGSIASSLATRPAADRARPARRARTCPPPTARRRASACTGAHDRRARQPVRRLDAAAASPPCASTIATKRSHAAPDSSARSRRARAPAPGSRSAPRALEHHAPPARA